jgi:nucleoside-diphosphate-sugar epimerase
MKTVLVAGATGYPGKFVTKAFTARSYWVRALGRNSAKLAPVKEYMTEVCKGEVTNPDSLTGLCDDVDIVFSNVVGFKVHVCARPARRKTATRCGDTGQAGVRRRTEKVE